MGRAGLGTDRDTPRVGGNRASIGILLGALIFSSMSCSQPKPIVNIDSVPYFARDVPSQYGWHVLLMIERAQCRSLLASGRILGEAEMTNTVPEDTRRLKDLGFQWNVIATSTESIVIRAQHRAARLRVTCHCKLERCYDIDMTSERQ